MDTGEISKMDGKELTKLFNTEVRPHFKDHYSSVDSEVLGAIQTRASILGEAHTKKNLELNAKADELRGKDEEGHSAVMREIFSGDPNGAMSHLAKDITRIQEEKFMMEGDPKPFPNKEKLEQEPGRVMYFLENDRYTGATQESLNDLKAIMEQKISAIGGDDVGFGHPFGSAGYWEQEIKKLDDIIEKKNEASEPGKGETGMKFR